MSRRPDFSWMPWPGPRAKVAHSARREEESRYRCYVQIKRKTEGIILNPPTFNSVSNHSVGKVRDTCPGVSVVCAADVAEPGHIFARHQLIGLRGVAQNSDEEQEEGTCELIIHGAWVHGAVAC